MANFVSSSGSSANRIIFHPALDLVAVCKRVLETDGCPCADPLFTAAISMLHSLSQDAAKAIHLFSKNQILVVMIHIFERMDEAPVQSLAECVEIVRFIVSGIRGTHSAHISSQLRQHLTAFARIYPEFTKNVSDAQWAITKAAQGFMADEVTAMRKVVRGAGIDDLGFSVDGASEEDMQFVNKFMFDVFENGTNRSKASSENYKRSNSPGVNRETQEKDRASKDGVKRAALRSAPVRPALGPAIDDNLSEYVLTITEQYRLSISEQYGLLPPGIRSNRNEERERETDKEKHKKDQSIGKGGGRGGQSTREGVIGGAMQDADPLVTREVSFEEPLPFPQQKHPTTLPELRLPGKVSHFHSTPKTSQSQTAVSLVENKKRIWGIRSDTSARPVNVDIRNTDREDDSIMLYISKCSSRNASFKNSFKKAELSNTPVLRSDQERTKEGMMKGKLPSSFSGKLKLQSKSSKDAISSNPFILADMKYYCQADELTKLTNNENVANKTDFGPSSRSQPHLFQNRRPTNRRPTTSFSLFKAKSKIDKNDEKCFSQIISPSLSLSLEEWPELKFTRPLTTDNGAING